MFYAEVSSDWHLDLRDQYIFRAHTVMPGFLGIPRHYLCQSEPIPAEAIRASAGEMIAQLCHTRVAATLESMNEAIAHDEKHWVMAYERDLRDFWRSRVAMLRWKWLPQLRWWVRRRGA